MIALGPSIGGVFSPSDGLAEELRAAGDKVGEKLWRMPLEESYWKQMASPVADMKNTGVGKGGACGAQCQQAPSTYDHKIVTIGLIFGCYCRRNHRCTLFEAIRSGEHAVGSCRHRGAGV